MTDRVEYLDLDDLLTLAESLLGTPVPIRDVGLLEAAVARPQASAFGEDAYADVFEKAAAVLQSIVKSHALIDGNKRLGWLATAVFLELNGVAATHLSDDEVVDLVVGVAEGADDVGVIADHLRTLLA